MTSQSTKIAITVSLAPDGSLQIELPGANDSARVIPLRENEKLNPTHTIRRILLSQVQGRTELGSDGAPTRAQLTHWERHGASPDRRCPFCRFDEALIAGLSRGRGDGESLRLPMTAEGVAAALPPRYSHIHDARYAKRKLGDGVTVRRVPAGLSAKALSAKEKTGIAFPSQIEAEDLGF